MSDLQAARDWVYSNLENGVTCPCCDQFAKGYKRKLNSGLAYSLLLFYRESLKQPGEWLHFRKILLRAQFHCEYTFLAYWGLVVAKGDVDPTGNHSGLFQITPLGIRFARGEVTVPKRVYQYNTRLLAHSTEQITIQEALQDRFNYYELMQGAA